MSERMRVPVVAGFAQRVTGADGPKSSPKEEGKELRSRVPRASHDSLVLAQGRPGAVQAVVESNRGRVPGLTPIRVGRMAATPFAFLRGAAGLMAHDLVGTPVTGASAQICGDAHAANFGLYGDARGRLVIDLNDFDETVVGPWEWDVKRLAASFAVATRESGFKRKQREAVLLRAVSSYREAMRSKPPAAVPPRAACA